MTDVLTDVLWTEKHRPTRLDQVALEDDTRRVLLSYLEAGEIPHLLFIGPPGSGKTTVARILYRGIDCQHIVLNASTDRGIDVVRERIGSFAASQFAARWNVVFLDEADAMTSDAQTALRNLIEAHADRTRFILTANHPYKIIPAIHSRCQAFTFAAPPLKERYRVLAAALTAEGVPADPKVVFGYAERYPDMRRLLNAVQKAWLASGAGADLPPAATTDAVDGATLFGYVASKNWTALRQLTARGDFDPAQGLRDLFWAVPDGHPRAGFLRHVIGRGVHESGFTPDQVVLFLGTCAECVEGLGG